MKNSNVTGEMPSVCLIPAKNNYRVPEQLQHVLFCTQHALGEQ
jgi:hypothetical protein